MSLHTVFKYQVLSRSVAIALPESAVILDCQLQDGIPTFWALVDREEPHCMRRQFVLLRTGTVIPNDGATYRHMATFQMRNDLVEHMFEVIH